MPQRSVCYLHTNKQKTMLQTNNFKGWKTLLLLGVCRASRPHACTFLGFSLLLPDCCKSLPCCRAAFATSWSVSCSSAASTFPGTSLLSSAASRSMTAKASSVLKRSSATSASMAPRMTWMGSALALPDRRSRRRPRQKSRTTASKRRWSPCASFAMVTRLITRSHWNVLRWPSPSPALKTTFTSCFLREGSGSLRRRRET
mmetsp:Transcript_44624/g.105809  ORF Transcript_44624/g.105809 Transcript_44624/m.105809 type:complete len:201 (-) Transcript_44624:1748-2350(-)